MLRHSRRHHRAHQARWRQRRLSLGRILFPFAESNRAVRLFATRLWITKHPDDRRAEERSYRQRVRRALARGADPPRYRHDWAD